MPLIAVGLRLTVKIKCSPKIKVNLVTSTASAGMTGQMTTGSMSESRKSAVQIKRTVRKRKSVQIITQPIALDIQVSL